MVEYTIEGSAVHSAIERKVREVEKQSKALTSDVTNYENQIVRFQEEHEAAYTKLAYMYLPDISAESVSSTLRELEGAVKKIFQEKQKQRKSVEDNMEDCEQRKEQLEERLKQATSQLNEKAQQRDILQTETNTELQQNPNYVELIQQADQARKVVRLYTLRLEEVKTQASNKLPAYRDERLFMYLLEREYNTPRYQASNLISRLDSIVAEVVGFKEAKKNYNFLTSMPELMNIEVEKRQEELDKLVKELKTIEDAAAERKGLVKVNAEGKALEEERAEIINKLSAIDKKYQTYTQQRKALDDETDEYHEQAISELRTYLKGEAISNLKERARSTRGSEDDQLVNRIETIDTEVKQLKEQAKDAKAKRDKVQGTLDGLKDILRYSDRNDYESSSSYFRSSFNIGEIITGIVAGKYAIDNIKDLLKKNQQFRRVRVDYSDDYEDECSNGDEEDDDLFSSVLLPTLTTLSRRSTYGSSSYHSSGGGGGGSRSSGGWGFGGGRSSSIGGFKSGGSRSIGGF